MLELACANATLLLSNSSKTATPLLFNIPVSLCLQGDERRTVRRMKTCDSPAQSQSNQRVGDYEERASLPTIGVAPGGVKAVRTGRTWLLCCRFNHLDQSHLR